MLLRTSVEPREDLAELTVACWHLESSEGGERAPDSRPTRRVRRDELHQSDLAAHVLLPDGATWILLSFDDNLAIGRDERSMTAAPRYCVVGPRRVPLKVRLGDRVRVVAVAFDATLTEATFGVPAAAIAGSVRNLTEFWGEEARMRADVIGRLEPADAARVLQGLLPGCGGKRRGLARLCRSGAMIRRHRGDISVHELASRMGVTRQYLARLFRDAVGWSVKEHIRLVRFNALAEAALTSGTRRLRDLTTELGLADQAHLIREFRRYVGKPPNRFFREGLE